MTFVRLPFPEKSAGSTLLAGVEPRAAAEEKEESKSALGEKKENDNRHYTLSTSTATFY